MFPTDFLIFLRERFLDIVSGSDRSETLNQEGTHDTDSSGGDLAAELIHLLYEVLSSGWVIHDENVDYAALHTSLLYEDFLSCTGKLSTFDPSTLPNSDAQLTFWINLYNILVLHGVIALDVRRSVMERRMGVRFFRQSAYIVGGQRMSCDDIEHGILRANRGHPFFPGRQFSPSDPRLKWVIKPFDMRVHFALNCASRSCPPIHSYSPENIDKDLDSAARSYLKNEVEIIPEEHNLHLPAIFKWFKRDFGGREGILDFILYHLSDGEEFIWLSKKRNRVSLRYQPYDWSLNGKT